MTQMKTIRMALVQMNCEKAAIRRNLDLMETYVAESKTNGIDIVCFPEMNITGYIDPNQYPAAILTIDHPAIQEVVQYSEQHSICIVAGFVEANPGGKPYINQFVARNGQLLGFYRKKTIKDGEEKWFSPGDERFTFTHAGLTIGLAVCADIDDPRILAAYATDGADLVLECAAPGLYGEQATRNWSSGYQWWRNNCADKLGKYASDGSMFIAVSTQAGRTIDEDFPGGGYLFSPQGTCIFESEDWSEGVLYVTVEIEG